VGHGTDERGRCQFERLPASAYRVDIMLERPGGDPTVVASGRVVVLAGATALLRIVVPD